MSDLLQTIAVLFALAVCAVLLLTLIMVKIGYFDGDEVNLNEENERLRQANQDFVAWEKACKADLDMALARVAKLEDVMLKVHKIASAEPKDRAIAALTGIDWSSEAWLLRKQAEAVEQTADAMALQGCNPSDTYNVRLRATRLTQQAAELEKGND